LGGSAAHIAPHGQRLSLPRRRLRGGCTRGRRGRGPEGPGGGRECARVAMQVCTPPATMPTACRPGCCRRARALLCARRRAQLQSPGACRSTCWCQAGRALRAAARRAICRLRPSRPPTCSTSVTTTPASASSLAAARPEKPPPMTAALRAAATSVVAVRGWPRSTRGRGGGGRRRSKRDEEAAAGRKRDTCMLIIIPEHQTRKGLSGRC
jgi:hypothetical protein